jgi:hypothetical protein
MKSCHRRLPRWGNVRENSEVRIRLAGPGFPGWGVDLRKLVNLNYNYYIQILLINTNILIYICHIMWKWSCSSSETTSSTWETTKSRRRKLPRWENAGKLCGGRIRLAGPGFPGMGVQRLINLNYNYYIQILLINTNVLIYICHILYWG